ncbi:MAG: thioredoxin family protein [Candidatus Hodarchaeales archaeon]
MSEVLILDDSTFHEVINKSDIPVFIDLWAQWCRPCLKISPMIEELAKEYTQKMAFGKVDVANNPEIEKEYNIMSLPMFLILYKDELLLSFVGALSKSKMIEKIEDGLEKYNEKTK